jgi:diguanylate cyclase (GGDEF)-like protein
MSPARALPVGPFKRRPAAVDGIGMSEAVDVWGGELAGGLAPANEREARRARLAVALQDRVEEISRTILATWHERSPEAAGAADLRVQTDILRTTELSTFAIVQYLSNGQVQSADQSRVIAASGKAPLRDTIVLAELTKLYFYWRDITLSVLTEEAERLGLGADVVRDATAIVRGGSDGSIVKMAKQFDSERGRLQRELAIEQARLEHHAFHDALTGLPNRRLFFDRLSHALDLSQRHRSGLGLLFADVDQFKSINDRFGHDAGDRVLVAVSERLIRTARDTDTVARLAGDEFVILYEQLHDPRAEGIALAERITRSLAEPIAISDRQIHASVSIGIAVTTCGGDADTLIRQADDAMYIAKREGPGHYRLWNTQPKPGPAYCV